MDEEKNEQIITITFELKDDNGAVYSATSTMPIFYDLGETTIGKIGEQFNSFLKQVGYSRPNDYIFMASISEEEYDMLTDVLNEYRDRNKSK